MKLLFDLVFVQFPFIVFIDSRLSFLRPIYLYAMAILSFSLPFIIINLYESSFEMGVSDDFDGASKLR